MINTDLVLIAIAMIILIGYLGDALFRATRIPEILILMLIGIILVPLGHLVPDRYVEVLRLFAPLFGSIALVIIMFDGGRKIDFGSLTASALGLLMGLLDILLPMFVIALIMNYLFGWPYIYGAMLGTIVGETTAVVIVPVASRIKIPSDLYNLAVTEATFNSVVEILIFYLLLVLITGSSFTPQSYAKYVVDYLSVAVFMGLVVGFLWLFALNVLKGTRGYVATIGVAFLLYGVVDYLGGAAVVSILIFAMIIGNYRAIGQHLNLFIDIHEKDMEIVEGELEFIVKTFFFVFIGMIALLSFTYFIYSLVITMFLLLIRYIEVRAMIKKEYRGFVFSLLPRGLTVAVLSSILYSMGGTYFNDIFYLSFMVIILTNIIASAAISRSAHSLEKSIETGKESPSNGSSN
ncbi:MAG: cation:proton antiporter [Thermocladium sp.]